MKLLIAILFLAALLLSGCSRTPPNAEFSKGVTVCGILTDDNHQPIANAFIELHHSAKDSAMASRYLVGRSDPKGQFAVEGVIQGQYWMAIIPKGACSPKSKEENESRRVEVDVPNGTPSLQCKTHWQVEQDASCRVIVE